MNMTLYLTMDCNLACTYCYQSDNESSSEDAFCKGKTITKEIARSAVDLSVKKGDDRTGICFFGGEPLLCKDVLYDLMEYCGKIAKTGHKFSFKLVTNGLLLDENFMRFANENKIMVALSHDGLMQDDCRLTKDKKGTFSLLSEKIDILLRYQPDSVVLVTVDPSCVEKLSESVKYLFNKGFKNVAITPRYAEICPWDDDSFSVLSDEFEKLSEIYVEKTLSGDDFTLATFDVKIRDYITGGKRVGKGCRLGEKQVCIMPDGKIYPCQQFIEDEYFMGDVYSGIIKEKLDYIKEIRKPTPVVCDDCGLKERCRYSCACLNKQCTGNIGDISPFQCSFERLQISCADKAAEILYKKGNTKFLKKQYGEFYNLIEI